MLKEYSRCKLGKRCVVKTDDSYIFRKFTLLVAIKNSKCVGWKLYEKGGMTKERLVEFLKEFVFDKYKNHLRSISKLIRHIYDLIEYFLIYKLNAI